MTTFALRRYQQATLEDALRRADEMRLAPYGEARRQLYVAPTGVGKGTVALALADALRERGARPLIITPRLEIVRGFAERLDPTTATAPLTVLVRRARELGVWTYGRLYSVALRERAPRADVLIVDEAHHWLDAAGKMAAILSAIYPAALLFGLTATGFRGTPHGTRDFLRFWGGPDAVAEILTWEQAAREGWLAIPDFRLAGLCDDEQVQVQGGEFVATSAAALVTSRAEAMASLLAEYRRTDDRPAMLVGPTSDCLGALRHYLERAGVACVEVLQSTRPVERLAAFSACRERRALLLSIAVVGEGVDLPWLRVLVDARPTLSPVVFLQTLGRITRPGDAPRYLCTNRNLERHLHLLGACAPPQIVAQSQQAFGSVGERAAVGRLGLERLGRLKRVDLPSVRGRASGYSLYHPQSDGTLLQYAIAMFPWRSEPVVSVRVGRGRWRRCRITDISPELPLWSMAARRKGGELSPKQVAWWARSAGRLGLDPGAAERGEVDSRAIDLLSSLVLAGGAA